MEDQGNETLSEIKEDKNNKIIKILCAICEGKGFIRCPVLFRPLTCFKCEEAL